MTSSTPLAPHTGLSAVKAAKLAAVGLVADRKERRELERPVPAANRKLSLKVERPIFILGAPRSGTTFLGSCVGALPEVSYHFEPRLTKAVARCVYEGSWTPQRAARYFRGYYGALLAASGHGGLRFAEKDPENCFIVPFLTEVFPDAVFLHVYRDGRDVAVSHAEQPWLNASSTGSGKSGRGGTPWGAAPRFWVEPERRDEFSRVSDLARSAWMWRRFTSSALTQLAELPADRVRHLRYEDIVSRPAEAAEAVADFLQVGDAAGRQALHARFGKARPNSVGRWRARLDENDLADVRAQAEPLLTELGYTT
ncbi:sulfotransferase [Micromonospora sp. R77]|uniref:sulfotransferase family protein n=1 Tax=Micromonospora sp. R77 TaxID=2925836 RepID=UPI001F602C2B|nr:sulfotransferase [Micromonospora sp. R77]MCI4063278.1 sulfotransferase [Micromonospora sp. R77]